MGQEHLTREVDDENLEELCERLTSAGLLPPEIGTAKVRELFTLFAANMRALRSYRAAGACFGGRLDLFLAADPSMEKDAAVAGWRGRADEVVVTELPGDHYGLLRSPGVDRLAAFLGARLDLART